MRKVLAITLAFVYLFIASGVVVSVHYCMGEVAGVAIGHSDADTCGSCGMDNSGCCHDDVSVVKIQDSHAMVNAQVDFVKAETLIQQYAPAVNEAATVFVASNERPYLRPPPKSIPSIHIQHCVFRI